MRILILNWRDINNPAAGGAEVLTHEVAKGLVHRGHEVDIFCASFPGCRAEDNLDGIRIIRRGRQSTVHLHAFLWVRQLLRKGELVYDAIIEEVNTIPFFTPLYLRKSQIRNYVLIHQLCREVWWYEMPPPINIVGYMLEPLYMRIFKRSGIITVSESTKSELAGLGFPEANIAVIPEGIDQKPFRGVFEKNDSPTLLFIGRLNKSKRPHHAIKAFSLILKSIPDAQLWVVGGGEKHYCRKLMKLASSLRLNDNITFFGFVPVTERDALMQRAHVLLVPSVKEGWGLVVTEANACGTPAVVYDVSGLRDSVRDGETGLICEKNTPQSMAQAAEVLLSDHELYEALQSRARDWSREFSWERTSAAFADLISDGSG